MALVPIHPFPARMAPELASRSLAMVPEGGLVLDPMCGSGTVARAAVEAATVLRRRESLTNDALAVAFRRIIVSKEMMASLARDTSHSRPHKVAARNDFDVASGFRRSARYVAARLGPERIAERADIRQADARVLAGIDDASVDLVLTSPPYLNAIDYLRGHRLALVWLGHKLAPLRRIRANSVGTERALRQTAALPDPRRFVDDFDSSRLTSHHLGWIRRYASDMSAILRQLRRVIKQAGRIVMVLGNSFLRGATVDNARLIKELAESAGFRLQNRDEREIPARRRYLPPPSAGGGGALDSRMRTETVLTFELTPP